GGCPAGGTMSWSSPGTGWGRSSVPANRVLLLRCRTGRPWPSLARCAHRSGLRPRRIAGNHTSVGRVGPAYGASLMSDPRLVSLGQAVPGLRLETDPAELEHYGRDWTRRWTPAPLAIALPADAVQVQAIVRWAAANDVAIVPSGGRTGLSGGAVAASGELVLSLARMNRVLDFDAIDRTLT